MKRFWTLQDIPRIGGGLALCGNCEFEPMEIEFQFDGYWNRYKFRERGQWVVLRDPFIEGVDYTSTNVRRFKI